MPVLNRSRVNNGPLRLMATCIAWLRDRKRVKNEADGPLPAAKNVGQSNATAAEEQAEAEATSKWKKKRKSGGYSKM